MGTADYNAVDGVSTVERVALVPGSHVRGTQSVDRLWVVGTAGLVLHFNTSHWVRQGSGTTVTLRGVAVL